MNILDDVQAELLTFLDQGKIDLLNNFFKSMPGSQGDALRARGTLDPLNELSILMQCVHRHANHDWSSQTQYIRCTTCNLCIVGTQTS